MTLLVIALRRKGILRRRPARREAQCLKPLPFGVVVGEANGESDAAGVCSAIRSITDLHLTKFLA